MGTVYYICTLTLLGVFGMTLWLALHFLRVQADLKEQIRSVKQVQEDFCKRIGKPEQAWMDAQVPQKEGMQESRPSQGDAALSAENLMESIKSAGFVIRDRVGDGGIVFSRDGEKYVILTERQPSIIIERRYTFDPEEWDIEVMRQAARQMSEDITMVKVRIEEDPECEGNQRLVFFLTAIERTVDGFSGNLEDYLEVLNQGREKMTDIFNGLMKRKRDALFLNSLAERSSRILGKIPS